MKEPDSVISNDSAKQPSKSSHLRHPSDQDLRDFAIGRLDAQQQHELEAHIGTCALCCQKLESLEDEPADDTLLSRLRQFDTSLDFDDPHRSADDSGTPQIPEELLDHPRYEILEHIGTGGMGQVFRARHRVMDKDVAIKIIKRQYMYDENAVKRFQKEIKAAAKLDHVNIVSSIDAEIEHDLNMLVMEFVPGKKLSEYVGKSKPLPIRHACHFARQVALGLQHAKEKGLTHRDIKPQNMLVVPAGGVVKIMDFGLAKFASESIGDDEESLTLEGESFGTPDYVAPEQIKDAKTADIRADIYSLGCTLYFILSGQKPFPLGSIGEKLAAHLEKLAEPIQNLRPEVPAGLCNIVNKMMAKDLNQRYQTPAEVVEELTPWSKKNWKETVGAADPAEKLTGIPISSSGQPLFDDSFADYADRTEANAAAPHSAFAGNHPKQPRISGQTGIRLSRRTIIATAFGILGVALISLFVIWGLNSLFKSDRWAGTNGRIRPSILVVVPANHAWGEEILQIKAKSKEHAVDVVFASSRLGKIDGVDQNSRVVDSVESAWTLAQADPDDFDAIVFTGAWDDRQITEMGKIKDVEYAFDANRVAEARKFIEQMLRQDKVVASVCGGNAVLIQTGTLNGRRARKCIYIPESMQRDDNPQGILWQDDADQCCAIDQGNPKSGTVITAREKKAAELFEEVIIQASRNFERR